MTTNFEVTKTSLSGMEVIFDNLELQILNENEMNEINGGEQLKWVDGKFVLVED